MPGVAEEKHHCGEIFARVTREFDRLNELSLLLMASGDFSQVLSGSSIRQYRAGWMLETYVEATIEPQEPLVAVWWIEIDEDNGALRIYAYASVDNRNYSQDLRTRLATTLDQFENELHAAVTELMHTYSKSSQFRRYLDSLTTKK